ncbi:alpha/beta fold hydrolase [Flagellimonas sp. 2504JD4-2]
MSSIKISLSYLVLFLSISLTAQTLERKPLLGVAYDTPEQKRSDRLPEGVEVKYVVPKSSSEGAGLEKGDIIFSYNNAEIDSKATFKKLIGNQRSGDKVKIKLIRNEKVISKKMTLTEFPREYHPDYETSYDAVNVNDYMIRSIITTPKSDEAKLPAVYIIQGIGCGRVENPFKNMNGVSDLITSLTQNGFITMRMERSGVGDSQGPPCQDINFTTDLNHFQAGLEKLKSYENVDQTNVFIVGISMGGIMAPLLASEIDVKGMVVYGTGGKDWYSYELENTFRQARLSGISPEKLNAHMQREQQRLHYFFTEKMTPDEIRKIDKTMGDNCENYPMHYSYFQDVADVDTYKTWSENKVDVLAIHGSSDFVSSGKEHELIAEMVNKNQKGIATYKEFPNADHWLLDTPSEKSSLNQEVEGVNGKLIKYMVEWIKSKKADESL